MKNKLMILLIIVLLTSFATAFEMDLGGLQETGSQPQTQPAAIPQQTAPASSSIGLDFTDMLADNNTPDTPPEFEPQLFDNATWNNSTLQETAIETSAEETETDEFGFAGQLADSNFETGIADMLADTTTNGAASEQEDDLFNNLAGKLKDPDKKVPGRIVGILKADKTEAEHTTHILKRQQGKIDVKINMTITEENYTRLAGPIKEILIKGHDETSPDNLLKIEQNLPRNITPFKSGGSFAIDPTQMNFTKMTLTFKASGSALYKCKAWNFTTKTCAPVQRDCKGEGKNQTCIVTGGWTKIMSLVPGRIYTLNITPEDPAFAQYNSTLGAPECANGESPCIATSALLQSRDNIGGTTEPNQPNTIDACTDGASGTYLTDESVENITVESLNGSYFRQGDTIRVNATFLCWNTANDNLNWVYANTTNAPGWSVKAFTDPCPVARPNFYQGSHTFTLDNNAGKHAVRIINQYNGNTATTCGGGAYDDNDDVAFKVYTRVPPNVTELRPVANTTYNVSDNVTVSAKVEDDETKIRYTKANITLPDGTSVLVNLSRKVIGEVLENRTINGSWRTINFTNTYDEPVVFASPLPLRDLRPAEVRITNVTSTGFTIRAQEPTGDFPEADNHSNEWPISILVLETGIHKLSDGSYIEVHKNLSTTTVSGTGPDAWTTYNYNINFSAIQGTPVLLAQVQTYNSPRFVATAVRNLNNATFQMSMEVAQDNASAHPNEVIGWAAIIETTNSTLNQTRYSAIRSPNTIRGYTNGCYATAHGLGTIPAAVTGNMQTRNGGNGGWARYCTQTSTWTSTNTYWTIDEVDNGERSHTTERVGYLAFTSEANLTDDRYWEIIFNQTQQRGRYNITFIASDIPGNINDTETTYFIIPTYPNVTLVSPPNATVQNTTTATFICNATDDFGLKNITFYLWNSTGGLVQSNTTTVSGKKNQSNITTTLMQGTYYWNCLATTVYGLTAYALDNYTITVDITDPVVNISSPVNGTTYNTTFNIPLNFTAVNGVAIDSCWYVLNAGAAVPIPGCLNTTINVSAGQNNLTVYANDTAGNIGNDSVTFLARWATTMLINTTKNPVENGERFYYYADYEYAHNSSDVLGATCTVEQLNATDVSWHNGLDDSTEIFNTTSDYYATKLDNLPANYVGDEYLLQIYLALNSTGNKNLRIWVTSNQSSWNSTQTYNETINTTTNPELNSTMQLINKTLNSSLFPAAGNYTIILSCDDCNSTDYYSLGKDTDNFGHSYEAQGTPVTWSNMSLDAFEHMMGILLTIKPIPMIYNSTNSRYERSAVQYLYSSAIVNYTYRINCSKTLHVPQTNKSTITVANNYIPQPNITAIVPDPARAYADDVQVNWTIDASGKAFGITTSYVNLTDPDGSFVQQYQGNPFTISKSKLTKLGNYTLTAFAENSQGSNTSNKTFLVISTAPNVTIIAPLGENYSDNTIVVISTNVTDPDGVDTVIASVDTPNGSQYNITLNGPATSDNFDNSSTLGTKWINITTTGPGQTCIRNINGTIPGRGFANLSGSGFPETFTICAIGSDKRVDGNFDLNVTWYWEAAKQYADGAVGLSLAESQIGAIYNRQLFIWYGNFTGVGTVIEIYGNDNGTLTRVSRIPIYLTNATMRATRIGNNFTFYNWNTTANNWTKLPMTKSIWNLSRALHVHMGAVAQYPYYGPAAASIEEFNIISENTTFGLFNKTSQLGLYNITIIANDTLGGINNSETTNFTIVFENDPPSKPFILSPSNGQTISGQYNITWLQVTDPENNTLEYNITLLNPNYTFNQTIVSGLPNTPFPRTQYLWDTTTIPDGVYSIRVTVYENNTPEKLSSTAFLTGNFTVINTRPKVTVITPINETFDNTDYITIAINATDPNGISSAIAQVTKPNTSIVNITLEKGQQSDNFDNSSTMNVSWIKDATEVGPLQTCIADINTTIPGQAFISLSGSGTPEYFTECSLASTKRIAGDFDISVDFDMLGNLNNLSSGINLYVSETLPTTNATRMVILSYANYAPDGNAYYAFSQFNGSGEYSDIFAKDDLTGKLRITRTNYTFRTYFWNSTLGNWTQIPLPINNVTTIGKSMYVALQAESSYPDWSAVNASFDNLTINDSNWTFGVFRSVTPIGRHNVTFIVTNNIGLSNNTETTWFNTTPINDPPTFPEILTPRPDATIGGQYLITWIESKDDDGDNILYNITLLNPDLTFNATIATNIPQNQTSYSWNTTLHNDGLYSMRVRAWENETAEKYYTDAIIEGDGNFTINNQKPKVIILAPLGQTFDQNSTVVISTNITSISPIATAVATVYSPNGSQYNVTLEKGLQSDDFDNSSSINNTWIKTANIAGSQTCTADINSTIPGRAFANLSGNGFPNTISLCGIGSIKRVDGDFDLNTTWYWEETKQRVDAGLVLTVSEQKTANFANRQLLIYYGNISGVGTATRIYANDNGTMQVISQVNKYLSNNSLRIVRVNNTFTIYSFNQSSGSWVQIPTLKPVLNLSRALHVQIGVASIYSGYSTAAASAEEINIQSDNTTFGLFNKTSQQGNYNTSIYVQDVFGGVNNTETTNFTINYTNNPPSVPFILKPDAGDVWSLFDYIAWIQARDDEGHSVKFNITLLNPDYTFNSTIVSNYGDITTALYNWNTSTVPDGIYSMKVKVFENNTPEKLSQSNTLLGNFTINNYGPKVFNLTPVNGSTFPSNTTVLIGANVTDIVGVDVVLVNVTLPDNTVQQIKLNYTAGDWYELNFTNTILDGTYQAKFIANDTYGKINDTEITFFVIPNDAPNITVNGPANGSNYTMNVFNITINATVTDKNNDSLCVKVHASNETPIVNDSYHLLARIGACYNQSTETVIYNWTSPVIQPDSNTAMLLHFDYDTSLGENTTHIYDFSGNGNNASCTSGSCPTYVSGKIGAAMIYAPGEYVTVQDSPTLDGMNEISIETWIKADDISHFNIIDKNQSYEIYTDPTGHVIFKLFNPNATVQSTSTIQIDKWHMIQATYNGSEMKIYFDGVLENTTARTGAVANTTGQLVIGIDSGDLASNGFEGIIDQVAVHNTSLSFDTIRNHYRLKNGTWYWHVHADDFINSTQSGEYHINIDVNKKPSITQVILNSTSGSNLPTDNLTRYVINATDEDGSEIKNITDWRVNNKSYAVLNMPFEANNWNETAWTKDFTKYKNNGKVFDAEWLKRGGYDGFGAYEFTGQQKIRVSHSSSLNISKEITMEAWVYPTQFIADGIIYAKPHTSFANPYIMYGIGYSSSNLRYDLALADGATQRNCPSANNAVKLNTWQHIAATFNGTTAKLYIDGKLNSSCSFTEFNISTNSRPLYLGHYPYQNNQYSYKGKLDEVRIYNKTLSNQQINAIYNNRTDLIVSQETTAGETWQACVTPNDRRENGAQVCSNNLTITASPKVYPDPTLTGMQYLLNETAVIRANITSASPLDTVYANVTLPNGTITRVNLTNISSTTYEANFTNLWLRGRYNITFYANNTAGFVNDSETSWFNRVSLDYVDIINGSMNHHNFADYDAVLMSNYTGTLTLNITINSTRVPSIILYNHSEQSMHSVIRLSDYTNEDNQSFADSWAIDLSSINMTYANVTANTDGNHLLKCKNVSWPNLTCADVFNYTYVKAVQNGTTYNVLLDATDPIFGTTITGNNSINDSTLYERQPNNNYGALALLRIGRDPPANRDWRPIIQFNLTEIPQGVEINNARIGLYFYDIPGGDATGTRSYSIHKVQQNPARLWKELQVTWNNYNTTNAWTAPGGDFGPATDTISFNSTALNSYVYWNVTADVQNFSDNRTKNFGWIIQDTVSAGNTIRDFRSKEFANASQRPVLLINYTEYTALLAARTNFTPFTFSSSAYVPVFTILFNTTMNQTNITMLSSFNIEKTTGTGIDIISAKVYLDGILVATDPDIRTAAIGEPQTAGIIPIMQNVTNGTHNITVEFKRIGNGNVKVSNIDFNIIEMTSAKGGIVKGQITPANYQHTTGGTGYPYAFNWTINRTCPGDAFVTSKGTHTSTGVNTAISYKFIDRDTLEESPTWEAVTLNSSDVHSMSGNWIFYNQIIGVNNMTVGSRNYQAGRTTTVNMTIFDAQMNDCANRTIQTIRTTSNLTNWSTALTINDTWTKITAYNVTMKYGTGLFVSFTSTPQLVGGDPNAQNLTQRITVRGQGANCTIEKELGLFGALDAGNLYIYTVCENLTVGQTYEVAGWGRAGAGRTYNQYDEALSAFEINPKPVQQIQLDTLPDLEPINLTFSDNNPKENQNITIIATVRNNGASASNIPVVFYDGNCTNGTQINGNLTILQLNKTQNTTVNVTWIASPIGPHNIHVCVDPNNLINESNETNNNLNNTLNVKAWQTYYGTAGGNITLQETTCSIAYDWQAISNGTIYITDIDNAFNFPYLQALGRNVTGGPSTNDFADADALLNMTGFNDSVQVLFAVNASVPKQTTTFTIINRNVQLVPYINSTNTSNFITGILWDTKNDTDGQYGPVDDEPLVFVANINRNATGKYGTYDYEIYIPRYLALYSGATDRVRFYTELR